MGGEGAGCSRGQGALTSPARHSRGSLLHVPRASPARSTCLRRARSRASCSRVRFFVPAHARPILTDRVRGPTATNRRWAFTLPAPPNPARPAPFPAHVVSGSCPVLLTSSGAPGRPPFPVPGVQRCSLPYARQAALGRWLQDRAGPSEAQDGTGGSSRSRRRPPPSPTAGRVP